MLILGIGYKARQGKGTAAQAIIDAHKSLLDIRGYGFSDALKDELYDALQNPLHPFWDVVVRVKKEKLEFYTPIGSLENA